MGSGSDSLPFDPSMMGEPRWKSPNAPTTDEIYTIAPVTQGPPPKWVIEGVKRPKK